MPPHGLKMPMEPAAGIPMARVDRDRGSAPATQEEIPIQETPAVLRTRLVWRPL